MNIYNDNIYYRLAILTRLNAANKRQRQVQYIIEMMVFFSFSFIFLFFFHFILFFFSVLNEIVERIC